MPGSEGKPARVGLRSYIPSCLFLAGGFASWLLDWEPGKEILREFGRFAGEMILVLPLVFILIGLVDVWVPRKRVEEMLGDESGLKGMLLVILLAFFNAGPLYGAFPIAVMLRRKGCSLRNIFVFLGAFAAMKIPMISFEIGFMGLKFSLLRLVFTLPVFIAVGILMEKLLGRGYEMRLPDQR
jgi:uncharacterized membrane protein YraQ (UPF0718 family)